MPRSSSQLPAWQAASESAALLSHLPLHVTVTDASVLWQRLQVDAHADCSPCMTSNVSTSRHADVKYGFDDAAAHINPSPSISCCVRLALISAPT